MRLSWASSGNILARLLLGDVNTPSVAPSEKLNEVVEAYGQCIAVLIASTRTYLDHRRERVSAQKEAKLRDLEALRMRLQVSPSDEDAEQQGRAELAEKIGLMQAAITDLAAQEIEITSALRKIAKLERKFRFHLCAAPAEPEGALAAGDGGAPDAQDLAVWDEETAGQRRRFECFVELDAQLIAIIPDDFLVARRWVLLDRMRRVAPQKALIEYEASRPPSLQQESYGDAEAIRADLLSLSAYMQQLYILNARREQTLASIKWWLLSRVLGVVVAIALIFWLATTPTPGWFPGGPWQLPWMPAALALVFLTGMVGAVVSISRKFHDIGGQNILLADPFNELVSLNFSRESVAGSIAAGGVFALVLYLMVVSGSTDALGLDVRFFPSLTERRMIIDPPEGHRSPPVTAGSAPATTAQADPKKPSADRGVRQAEYIVRANDDVPSGIAKLSKGLGFFYTGDILRMMLLAFLAGFAERLVPDSIDRLVRKEKAVKDAAV